MNFEELKKLFMHQRDLYNELKSKKIDAQVKALKKDLNATNAKIKQVLENNKSVFLIKTDGLELKFNDFVSGKKLDLGHFSHTNFKDGRKLKFSLAGAKTDYTIGRESGIAPDDIYVDLAPVLDYSCAKMNKTREVMFAIPHFEDILWGAVEEQFVKNHKEISLVKSKMTVDDPVQNALKENYTKDAVYTDETYQW